MKHTKRMVSLVLSVVFSAISFCLPLSAGAEDTYTTETNETITRFVPTTKTFSAGETKTFQFTVDTTADYALFMDAPDDAKRDTTTVFKITETDSGTAVPFTAREDIQNPSSVTQMDSYSYVHTLGDNTWPYERVGNTAEVRVALTAGTEYTLSMSREAALATFNYVELKCLKLPITGGKQAISPSDFTAFNTTQIQHVNDQFNYSNPLVEGYDLIGDYTDDSVFSTVWSNARPIHISSGTNAEYTLDVQQAGWYRISFNTTTWVRSTDITEGKNFSFNVPLSIDEEPKETLIYSFTATEAGQSLPTKLLNASPIYLDEGEHTLKFGNTTAGAYAYNILLEELPDYDPDAQTTVDMTDLEPVKVDDTLSRFELETPVALSLTGNSYAFSFTPAATGEYAFFLDNTGSATGAVKILVNDAEDGKVFEQEYTTIGRTYERFGDNVYMAAPMTAGQTYTITMSGSGNAVTMGYFDVRCVSPLAIPAEGKFAVSPSDYVVTTIENSHMSQQFSSQNYKNTDYPMIGDYYSEALQSPRDRATTVHLGNGAYVTYALNVTTPGYFTLTLPNVTTYPDASAESIRLSVNGAEYDTQGWEGTATDLTFEPFYLYAGVNRITLTNLTVPNDVAGKPDGSDTGSYIKSLLFDQEASEPEPTSISGDTKADSMIPLNSMTAQEGTIDTNADGALLFKAGSSVTYEVNVEEAGTYAIYMDGKAAQQGVDVLVDGESKLGATYITTGQMDAVTASFNNRQVKKLSYAIDLTAGEHTIQFAFKNGKKWVGGAASEGGKVEDITTEDNYTSEMYSIWVRRIDLTANANEEMFLRSWDFTATSFLNEEEHSSSSAGWTFPHQYTQGGPFTVGSFTDCRSVVFIDGTSVTYKINIPQDGYYNISAFIVNGGSSATNTITMTIGEDSYTKDHVSDGNNTMDASDKVTFDPVFLAEGSYDVIFKAPAKGVVQGTLRLYGVSVAKQSGDLVAVGTDSASVSVSFDGNYTGCVVTAFYSATNELVGVLTEDVEDAASYSADVTLSGTPVKAKVMLWSDMTNVKPLSDAIEFTSGSANWITK